jgi:hypothetical protein
MRLLSIAYIWVSIKFLSGLIDTLEFVEYVMAKTKMPFICRLQMLKMYTAIGDAYGRVIQKLKTLQK